MTSDALPSAMMEASARAGRPDDLAQGDLLAMTNGFMTGTIIDIEGGGLL
ncbi:hypothetical protein [Ralstonia syzygii]|nr:hypothetical protein [Ralstonia syzygii]CAH0445562.1 hypothetical protein LMG10661_01773 [Ralstonia syzygii subsp. syzygii]